MSTEQSQNEILLSQRQIEINEELNALTKQYEQGIIKKKSMRNRNRIWSISMLWSHYKVN